MERLDPEKLHVEFRRGVTASSPTIGRKYTLTHSDKTADLFLVIGLEYAFDQITIMRDEVLAEWKYDQEVPVLFGYVYVGQFGPVITKVRDAIFRRELPLALEAIIYGDRELFRSHTQLEHAPIWIHFASPDPKYEKFEYWGTPADYM
jgi:hypothetical protein